MSAEGLPKPTPTTQPYWDAAAEGRLSIQRCLDCVQPFFYPRPVCPNCGSSRLEWFEASGEASLYSYIINERPAPGHEPPFVIAVVALEEGPRMLTNIVGVEPKPEALELDMRLSVQFERRGEISLPVFAPKEAAA